VLAQRTDQSRLADPGGTLDQERAALARGGRRELRGAVAQVRFAFE
jgi:hypothetical protein